MDAPASGSLADAGKARSTLPLCVSPAAEPTVATNTAHHHPTPMKTASFAAAFTLCATSVSACSSITAVQRQLQLANPTNNQGPFRPSIPMPQQPNEFMPGPPSGPVNDEAWPSAMQPGNVGGITNTEADAASPSVEAPTATAQVVGPPVATPGEIAPGQPTIMVILPDFLAAGSGWSSYADDVGDTTAPSSEKPAQGDEKVASTASSHRLCSLAGTGVVLSMVVTGLLSTTA